MKRRAFLKTSAAAIAAPYFVPRSVFAANAPSNRINVGFIGCGNQSTLDLPAFLANDDVQVLAVCDVNTASHGYRDEKQFLGRKPQQDFVNAHYAAKAKSGEYRGCDAYHDFRDVLARRFRFNLDYSGGQVTIFGAHSLDVAQWGHGSERTGPVEFENLGAEFPPPGSLLSTATKVAFRARYADGVELTCTTKPKSSATRFIGTDGWVQYESGKLTHSDGLDIALGPNDKRLPVSNERRKENSYNLYLGDHVRNFLDGVKSRRDPISPVAATTMLHRVVAKC